MFFWIFFMICAPSVEMVSKSTPQSLISNQQLPLNILPTSGDFYCLQRLYQDQSPPLLSSQRIISFQFRNSSKHCCWIKGGFNVGLGIMFPGLFLTKGKKEMRWEHLTIKQKDTNYTSSVTSNGIGLSLTYTHLLTRSFMTNKQAIEIRYLLDRS